MHARRRKKRAQYGAVTGTVDGGGARTVALRRGDSGFGFTISGQQPCILSCIVSGSNADLAGLRAGNFLISVNGVNVSKAPHDTVVQLIGNSAGVIDMTVAESYYSDSSEEDCVVARVPAGARVRPKHIHKMKTRPLKSHHLMRSSRSCNTERDETYHNHPNSKCSEERCGIPVEPRMPRVMNDLSNIRVLNNPRVTGVNMMESSFSHINNVDDYHNMPSTSSARNITYENTMAHSSHQPVQHPLMERESPIECSVVIGYLGTIEMPKQIATSSKLQTVRSCIRKLRQEKRSSTIVLMTILPSSMTLKNSNGVLLAEYACRRINYVSCMSENDYRYFGLVTSATHIDTNENSIFSHETDDDAVTVEISHSCHVFTIDPKLIEHASHALKASEFRITCTLDPVTNHCLEFPTSAEYIVNIIRLMYSLKFPNGFSGKSLDNLSKFTVKSNSPVANANFSRRPPLLRGPRYDRGPRRHPRRQNVRYDNFAHPLHVENYRPDANDFMANSPQPSNHSEITTTSSNSDSGIGFHNDCQNISDRILVVDFANPPNNFNMNAQQQIQNHYEPSVRNNSASRENKRPLGISGAIVFDMDSSFLSNTTPVVEGFGGLGQPLNQIDNEILPIGDIPQSVYNANILNVSNRSKTSQVRSKEKCSPCHSRHISADHDKLNVRAMIGSQNYAQVADGLTNIKCHYTDDSSTSYSSTSRYQNVGDDMHYDPVYTEPEDHHYEMIKPSKDSTKLDEQFRYLNLYVDCYPNENCTERCEEVVPVELKSNCTESVDDMTVVSSKSCDYIHNRQVSIDELSMYSTRSQENPYKTKHLLKTQSSVDDILMLGLNGNARNTEEHTFLHPANVKSKFCKRFKAFSKSKQILNRRDDKKPDKDKKSSKEVLNEYKLSPKVFDMSRPSVSADNLCEEHDGVRACSDSEEGGAWWHGAHLEGTRSEPDLRSPERTQQAGQECESEQSSPFRRWTSNGGAAAAALGHRSYRRPGSLVASSDHDMYSKCGDAGSAHSSSESGGAGGVSCWSLGLEHLLADPAGSAAFAAFLAQEFSAENIKFWWACERYRTAGTPAYASEIWSRHLAEGAPEPVNVDAHARQAAHRALQDAPPDLFAQAQKQIFNLMKFDSYPRFLRSDVHAQCARAELRGQPPPYPPQHTPTPTKLKKSMSNAEERRRGSILTWARLRGASKERPAQQPTQARPEPKADDKPEDGSRRPSISSSVIRAGCVLCRVLLPDAATSIVAVDDSSIRQVVDRLLEKRAIRCNAYDVIVQGESRPLDVTAPSATIGGKEVVVERRVVFRLELPSRRVVSVRTRPGKPLAAVLKPALDRYSHTYAEIKVTRGCEPVPLDTLVQDVDGARLQVFLTPSPQKPSRTRADEPANQQSCPTNQQPACQQGKQGCHSLDEITNRVFEEVLQGKAELQAPPTDNSMKSENCSSEHSSCALRGGRSVVAKLRAGVHLQNTTLDNNEFLENLRQTQRARLNKSEPNCVPKSPTKPDVTPPIPAARNITKPCPAVRTSLNNKSSPTDDKPKDYMSTVAESMDQSTEKLCNSIASVSTTSSDDSASVAKSSDPPPLPPKPKVLPTKPSNWGNNLPEPTLMQDVNLPMNVIDDMKVRNKRMVYLDQPTSSFV